MLFTPKKYGKDWTRFLAVSFCAASVGFALFAISAPWMAYDDLSDKTFVAAAFTLGAIVFGALGRDRWKRASEMTAGDRRPLGRRRR